MTTDINLVKTELAELTRTKTIATVGPACSSREKLLQLIAAGVDIFRLNMAHGSRPDHELAIDNIRWAGEQTQSPIGILVDLAGPKIRLGQLARDPLALEKGKEVTFVRGTETDQEGELVCLYEPLINELSVGDAVVLADGNARLEVVSRTEDRVTCAIIDGGNVRSRQGVNLPGTQLSIPALGPVDRTNAVWAASRGVDFVSLSFVRNADEMEELKDLLAAQNATAITIAKIEKREALENLESIVQASGAVMVARGDLGVEIDIEKTPMAQKRIINVCLQFRKPVIVATQMLESMHQTKQPTRAEVSDVANAILDGADVCMLSGETAIGEYPVEAAGMMKKIMRETEKMFQECSSRVTAHDHPTGWGISEAVIFGSAQIARRIEAKMVVIATTGGETALLKSKQRDFIPTICITDSPKVFRRMALYWGVVPVMMQDAVNVDNILPFVDSWARTCGGAESGDSIVIVCDTELLKGVHETVMVTQVS